MTRFLAFILILVLVQPFAPQANSEPTPSAIADGRYVSEDELMSPGTGGDAEELEATKEAYFGKGSSVCKTKSGSTCYRDGACCKGGARCKILYKKIKKKESIVNFCK